MVTGPDSQRLQSARTKVSALGQLGKGLPPLGKYDCVGVGMGIRGL